LFDPVNHTNAPHNSETPEVQAERFAAAESAGVIALFRRGPQVLEVTSKVTVGDSPISKLSSRKSPS
jgi:hypothetical protein